MFSFLFFSLPSITWKLKISLCDVSLIQAMGRSGLAGPSMDSHMDMSHLQMPKHMSVPPQEEPNELEDLEQFAKAFKQRRIKLGFTQVTGRNEPAGRTGKLLLSLSSGFSQRLSSGKPDCSRLVSACAETLHSFSYSSLGFYCFCKRAATPAHQAGFVVHYIIIKTESGTSQRIHYF